MRFGAWAPDNAGLGSNNLAVCRNVYAADMGYRPVKAMEDIVDALPASFLGGTSYRATDGTIRLLGGTATDLYSYSGGSWSSILGSLTVTGRWRFVQFGNYAVAAYGGAPVEVDLGANTAAALTGSPPDADLVAVVRDFVVLGRCDGDELLITWSGFNDHTEWTAGTNQSGFQPMLSGGRVMGITGGEYGIILQRERIVRMTYTGDPDAPFQFDEISTNYGCIADGSVVQAGNITFCYSRRGFIKIEAGQVTPIGVERVDKAFSDAYAVEDFTNLWSTVDPERTLVIWLILGRVWCYNWSLDRWTDWDVPADAIFGAFSAAVSIDDLDAIYGDLDSVTLSLDDPRFAGGEPYLFLVARDGTFNILNGSNMAASFEFAPLEFNPGRRTRLSRVRPVLDAVGGVTLAISAAQRIGDDVVTDSYTQIRASGDMPVRTSGRYLTLRLDVAAGEDWTYAQGIELPGMAVAGVR